MNTVSSTSTALSSRPGFDPVFGQLGGVIRTTLRSLELRWFLYRAQRRKTRATEPVSGMNGHMLRDIGAPDEMIASAAAEKPAYARHGIPFGLSVVLVALALIGTPTPTSAEITTPPCASGKALAQGQVVEAPLAGVFAGEYVNGAPVYRFPAIVVTGSSKDATAARPQPRRQTLATGLKSRA